MVQPLLLVLFYPVVVEIDPSMGALKSADHGHYFTRQLSSSFTMEEVERRFFASNAWEAPVDHGLPALVWQHLKFRQVGRALDSNAKPGCFFGLEVGDFAISERLLVVGSIYCQ